METITRKKKFSNFCSSFGNFLESYRVFSVIHFISLLTTETVRSFYVQIIEVQVHLVNIAHALKVTVGIKYQYCNSQE